MICDLLESTYDFADAPRPAHSGALMPAEVSVMRSCLQAEIRLPSQYHLYWTPFYARGSCMQSVKFRSVISPLLFHARARGRRVGQLEAPAGKCCCCCSSAEQACNCCRRPAQDPPLAACSDLALATVAASFAGLARSSQARFGGLTLVSRAPWLLVTGAPGLFSWPNTLWNTAVACRMSPTSRTGQAAASRRHRHRNSRGAAAARP